MPNVLNRKLEKRPKLIGCVNCLSGMEEHFSLIYATTSEKNATARSQSTTIRRRSSQSVSNEYVAGTPCTVGNPKDRMQYQPLPTRITSPGCVTSLSEPVNSATMDFISCVGVSSAVNARGVIRMHPQLA